MDSILEINSLSKKYNEFMLDHINLVVPKGCIMGFIGENGAGKSTTIKLILNLIHRDHGEIKVFGLDNIKNDNNIKQQIGVVFDESNFPDNMKLKDIDAVMKHVYTNWDSSVFKQYTVKFSLPVNTTVKEYSRGMKMKLSIAVALSHDAKLLVLDEATSGLDPIVREEILDVFLEFIQDGERSIFISSHITSDLDKIADYITFIHKGKIVLSETKDNLLYDYGLLKCSNSDYEKIDKDIIIGCRKNQFGVDALVKKNKVKGSYTIDNVSIEDIMLFYIRGEVQ